MLRRPQRSTHCISSAASDGYKSQHFDIAGPAFVEKAWGYNPYGASGTGVRMAVQFIKDLTKL